MATILLAIAFVVLWLLKRKGLGLSTSTSSVAAARQEVRILQRLRLSASSSAVVLGDGQRRWLIVESRQSVQMRELDERTAEGHMHGRESP